MNNKKCVIIGSGLGGLSTGLIMARNGFDVTILEAHTISGGCLQTFRRGTSTFETGMHVAGSAREGEILNIMLRFLDADELPLSPLDTEAYQTVSLPQGRFTLPNGIDNFTEKLCSLFPSERDGLHRYHRLIEEIGACSTPEAICRVNTDISALLRYQTESATDVLDSLFTDKTLKAILGADAPLYAGQSGKTPFSLHAFLRDFYCRSSFRFTGGSSLLNDIMCRNLSDVGARVLTGAKATKICFDNTKATAVEINGSDTIEADIVISTIHPAALAEIIDTPLIRPAYRRRLGSLPAGPAPFSMYMRFRPRTMPMQNTIFFGYSSDPWHAIGYTPSDWPRGFMLVMTPDKTDCRYAATAQAITYMNFSETEPWAHTTRPGLRGESYEAFKKARAATLTDAIERHIPGLSGCVEATFTSTPLTYRDYTSTSCGSMYGIERNVRAGLGSHISVRTRVPNLFLAGQSTNSHGILGVIIGSILACSETIGSNTIYNQIIQANR